MEQILLATSSSKSPITGDKFDPLSPEYAKHKQKEVGNKNPDLTLSGLMLDSLSYDVTDDGLEIGVYGAAAGRADGHNNFSGNSELPLRQFLPDVGDEFAGSIQNNVDQIIAKYIADVVDIPIEDLEDVSSSRALYALLADYFEGYSKAQIAVAVRSNTDLLEMLDENDLLEYL